MHDPQVGKVQSEYDVLAAEYDIRWSRYTAVTIAETLARTPSLHGLKVLDVGCGTGALLGAVRGATELHGIDIAPGMLQVAKRRLGAGAHLALASAERLPYRDASFDCVISTSSLHFWSNPRACIREFWRVLRPRGSLVVTDWCDDYIACRLCDWYLRVFDPAHVRAYGLQECQRLVEDTGFALEIAARYKVSWLWGLMTVRARRD